MDPKRQLAATIRGYSIIGTIVMMILMIVVPRHSLLNTIVTSLLTVSVALVILSDAYHELTEPKPGARTGQDKLLQSLRFYRGLGFFEEHKDLSDEELLCKLKKLQEEEWGESDFSSRRDCGLASAVA